jgi:Tol biopolymer transport system component/DNA-binding winged helix-turn-helix (wHTH) protein
MNPPQEFRSPFRLGDWVVRPGLNRIQGPDAEIQVEPRVMQVLLRLAEHPGQVRSRLGLLEEVWGDAIVGEENLTRAISELRRIFGDQPRQPRFIETIRNHGYRLMVETEVLPSEPDTEPPAPEPPVPEPAVAVPVEPVDSPRRRRVSPRVAVTLVLLVVLASVFGPRLVRRLEQPSSADRVNPFAGPTARPNAVPLTTFTGREWHPALSPDGQRIAFIWAGPEGANIDVYLKQRNSEAVLRLTDDPSWAAWPAWSPDGQTVAFVQQSGTASSLCSVPTLGGAIRTLVEVDSWVEGLDWEPDGSGLVFSARVGGRGDHRLQRLDLETLLVAPVPIEREDAAGDFLPRLSPDGSAVAWIGTELTGNSGVFVAPARGGQARMMTESMSGMQGLTWQADGSAIVFAEEHAGLFSLWRIDLSSGWEEASQGPTLSPEWVPTPSEFAWNPAAARKSGELVYEQVRLEQDIWRLDVRGSDPWQVESRPFLRSTRWESGAAFDPNGQRVVFVSSRSGSPEIWICDATGESLQQLTTMGFASVGNPSFSPDGKIIAANVVREGLSAVVTVLVRGGAPRFHTPDADAEVFSAWSATGGLLVASITEGQWQVFEADFASGNRSPRTIGGGMAARESADGEYLYYTRPGLPGLWRIPRDGNEAPDLVVEDLDHRDRHNWILLQNRLIWVLRTSGAAFLVSQDVDSGESSLMAELPDVDESGLGVSPDGNTIFYTRTRASEGDVMLLEGAAGLH